MSRQTFTDRNAWHFAVAASFPFARVATKVLTEARLTDGAEIAEWDFATNTGWMRSIVVPQAVPATDGHATDGHAGYLLEGGKAAWYVCEAHHDVFTAVDPKAYSSKDAAYQSPIFDRDNGSRDIIAVHGILGADKKTVVPADLNESKVSLDEAAGASDRFIVYSGDVKTAIAVVTSDKAVATAWAADHFKTPSVVVIAGGATAELKAAGVDAKFLKPSRTDTVITKAKAEKLMGGSKAAKPSPNATADYTPPNIDIAKASPFPAVIVLGEWTTQPGDILNRNNTLRQEGMMVRNTVEGVDGKVVGVDIDVHDVWNEWILVVTAGGKKAKWRGDAVNSPATGWGWPDRSGRQVAKKP